MTKTFSIRVALREGFSLTRENLGRILLVMFLMAVIIGTMEGVARALEQGEGPGTLIVSLLYTVLTTILQYWLYVGAAYLVINATATGRVVIADLFAGLPFLLRYIGLTIILSLINLLVFLPGLIAMVAVFMIMGPSMEELSGFGPGMFLSFVENYGMFLIAELVVLGIIIIPVFIVAIYLGFSIYLLVDKRLGVLDALPFSVQVAKGNVWKLVNFSVVLALLNVAGALCLLVGLLITIPVSTFAHVCVYRDLMRQTEAQLGHPLGKAGILSESTGELT